MWLREPQGPSALKWDVPPLLVASPPAPQEDEEVSHPSAHVIT